MTNSPLSLRMSWSGGPAAPLLPFVMFCQFSTKSLGKPAGNCKLPSRTFSDCGELFNNHSWKLHHKLITWYFSLRLCSLVTELLVPIMVGKWRLPYSALKFWYKEMIVSKNMFQGNKQYWNAYQSKMLQARQKKTPQKPPDLVKVCHVQGIGPSTIIVCTAFTRYLHQL